MAQTSDPSSNALPRAELNPLLNPLLAENMTRWAEVYFNNPPERREQAVLELLRELEAQRVLREAATGVSHAMFSSAPQVSASRAAHEPERVRCERCGRDNPVGHKFCGMCGETLHPQRITEKQVAPTYSGQNGTEQQEDGIEAELGPEGNIDRYQERYVQPASNWNGLSLFQSGPQEEYEDYDDGDAAYESSRSHYRIYVGGVLAIVLLALGYTAWRASQNSQGPDEPSSSPPPVAAKEAPAETAPATAAPATKAKENAPALSAAAPSASAPEKPAPPATKAPRPAPPDAEPDTNGPDSNTKETNAGSHAASARANSGAARQPSTGGGSEELAQAESYLNGTSGRGRNSVAAAALLWKSVAKHNGAAELLLADLYLKGDGVAKSCDQARVLLYAAARKSISGSGDRLRNMQAFGCQ